MAVITEQLLEKKGSQLLLHSKSILEVTSTIHATPSGLWTAVGEPEM